MPKAEDLNDLADYTSDDEDAAATTTDAPAVKKDDTYSALHSSGFREFLLRPELLRAIVDAGFEHPSTVQNEALPQAIIGTDVICQANSGMGKTAVFVLSVLHQIVTEQAGIQALVLCHTRELAYQIKHEFIRFQKYMPEVKTEVVFGGDSVRDQTRMLKETPPHILIATPGRLRSLVDASAVDFKGLKYFVIDECDRVLEEMDMRSDVQKIFIATPRDKQVMMFSATLPDEVRPVCKKFMHDPLEVYISAGSKLTLHGLKQYYVQLEEKDKLDTLISLLDNLMFNQVVVFVNQPSMASKVNKVLDENNFPSICIYGRMNQKARTECYKQFKEFKARVMIATDLFGRGIDVERVNVVINFDMPGDADQYLHRVGRAGRFGTKGLAISFVSSDTEAEVLNQVQSRFVVEIPEKPEEIDASLYMEN